MDWRFNTIWFDQLEKNKIFTKDFKLDKTKTENNIWENAEYGIIWHLKKGAESFENLNSTGKLLHLELYFSNITDFSGIKKITNLKRLELYNCYKLESDFDIQKLSNSLEFLHINQCKKFKFAENLLDLKKIKVLRLNSCASIKNLDFLTNFPNLIDFRFVDTEVLDGNLNQILEHPTIRSVGFVNKRHYNFKFEELQAKLKMKNESNYKITIYKGEYSTFKYDYE